MNLIFHERLQEFSQADDDHVLINRVLTRKDDYPVGKDLSEKDPTKLAEKVSKIIGAFLTKNFEQLAKRDIPALQDLQVLVHMLEVRSDLGRSKPTILEKTISKAIELAKDENTKGNDFGFWADKCNKSGQTTFWKTKGQFLYAQTYRKNSPEVIHRDWENVFISNDEALPKMIKNELKALIEHRKALQDEGSALLEEWNPYIDLPQLEQIMEVFQSSEESKVPELKFCWGLSETIGLRDNMEDAHFTIKLPGGILTGIFDGHGGKEVADYANKRFQILFPRFLQGQYQGNVFKSFEATFSKIQAEIVKNQRFNEMGSTAVISYIDKETNFVYTATAGDSEAHIYRQIDGDWKCIPLSCVRDWGSKRDEARAEKGTAGEYNPPVVEYWRTHTILGRDRRITTKAPSKKEYLLYGNNVSRGFGDHNNNIGRPIKVMQAKPKISVFPVQPGDVLVLACDGLRDYSDEYAIVAGFNDFGDQGPEEISKRLVDLSLQGQLEYAKTYPQCRGDNVTVSVIRFSES